MTIIELIRHLMPDGTDAYASSSVVPGVLPSYHKCPTWPADLFGVMGTIIERSGCYTLASPDRSALADHERYLETITDCANAWNADISQVPDFVEDLWHIAVNGYAGLNMDEISADLALVKIHLALFAIADEACAGMGWDVDPDEASTRKFSSVTFAALTGADALVSLPYGSMSLCVMVPPDRMIVLPKSITSSVGCTLRSLSHYLALLPPSTVLEPSWFLSSKRFDNNRADPSDPYTIRLLLVPFPFKIHASSFKLSFPRTPMGVLSFTCAAMVDRSNWLEAKPARSIGLWRDGAGRTQEIGLPDQAMAVVLTLQSKQKHQNTLDNRSDNSLSRQLTLRTVVPLFLADRPDWI